MIHEVIEIDIDYKKYGIDHKGNKATITTYIKDMFPDAQNSFNRPLVVIAPGGGYGHHSPREGEAVALKFLSLGMNAVVLRYSLLPNEHPCALYEAAYTLNYVREHAKEWDVNPNNIVMAGFSAGGHVAASLGTLWNCEELREFVDKEFEGDAEKIRPDRLLLGYPVITSGEFAHKMSFIRLLGERHDKLAASLSLENRVSPETPETFLWHTFTDGSVPLENSLLFASALRKNNVKFELHVFPEGNHGLGLGTKETDTKDGTHYQPEVSGWPEMFATWMGLK